jgi:outer membrane lipoprotein-sorting protein
MYENLSSYQDEGSSVTTIEGFLDTHSEELHFTTVFKKPGRFRFEYWKARTDNRNVRMVVWYDGTSAKSWWTLDPKVETHHEIGRAIAGATGVSGGTAYLIPSILIKEAAWKGCTWTCPEGTYRIKDGLEGNTRFYRIQQLTATQPETIGGRRTSGTTGKVTYWIAQETFLLAKVEEETDFGTFTTRQSIRYAVKVNSPIPEEALAFGH